MVSLLEALIQADNQGTWNLHLQTFLTDCTTYTGVPFISRMRKLPQTAPEIYHNFLAGKFTVKQSSGLFRAVGTDMCLEQPINQAKFFY